MQFEDLVDKKFGSIEEVKRVPVRERKFWVDLIEYRAAWAAWKRKDKGVG